MALEKIKNIFDDAKETGQDIAKEKIKQEVKKKVIVTLLPYIAPAAAVILGLLLIGGFTMIIINNPCVLLSNFEMGTKFEKEMNVSYTIYNDSKNILAGLIANTPVDYIIPDEIEGLMTLGVGLQSLYFPSNTPIYLEEAAIFISLYYEEVPEWMLENKKADDTLVETVWGNLTAKNASHNLFYEMAHYFYFNAIKDAIAEAKNKNDNSDDGSPDYSNEGEIVGEEEGTINFWEYFDIVFSKSDIFEVAETMYNEVNNDGSYKFPHLHDQYNSIEELQENLIANLSLIYDINEQAINDSSIYFSDLLDGEVFYPEKDKFVYKNIVESYSISGTLLKTPATIIEALKDSGIIWPLATHNLRIGSGFGPRNLFSGASTNHRGIDLGNINKNVVSVLDGKVFYIEDNVNINYYNSETNSCSQSSGGNYVIIEHTFADSDIIIHSVYMHLDSISNEIKKNPIIKKGQVIGIMGNTGCSSGPHLHFGLAAPGYLYRNNYDAYFNPLDVLPIFSLEI